MRQTEMSYNKKSSSEESEELLNIVCYILSKLFLTYLSLSGGFGTFSLRIGCQGFTGPFPLPFLIR